MRNLVDALHTLNAGFGAARVMGAQTVRATSAVRKAYPTIFAVGYAARTMVVRVGYAVRTGYRAHHGCRVLRGVGNGRTDGTHRFLGTHSVPYALAVRTGDVRVLCLLVRTALGV